jgi:archaeal type IV pilus assembly protein PilA
MKINRSDEEAVSPVIGVILMVAIVVILAAVIAAFVFGMAGTTTTAKNVGVIVTQTASGADITWQGGTDLAKITSWTARNATANVLYVTTPATPTIPVVVGEVDKITTPVVNGRVIITATFADGASQVIYDRQF